MPLQPGKHKYKDLAKVMVQNSKNRGSSLTAMQKKALKFAGKELAPSSAATSKLTLFYGPVFDKLFFFESLKGRVRVAASGEMYWKDNAYGWTTELAGRPDKAQIVVNSVIQEMDGQARIRQHISTLLHEMIHAFLIIYGPRGVQSARRSPYRRFSEFGYSGHGVAFMDIALALEKAVNDPTFWGVPLYLGRDVSMALELKAARRTGEHIDPMRWGLDKHGRYIKPPNKYTPLNYRCSGMPADPAEKSSGKKGETSKGTLSNTKEQGTKNKEGSNTGSSSKKDDISISITIDGMRQLNLKGGPASILAQLTKELNK